MKAVTVIGIGDEGCVGLSSKAMGAVARAQVLAGGKRHLEFFPEFEGRKVLIQGEILKTMDLLAELSHEHTICVLASGDPLFYGIGKLVRKKIGASHVEFIPSPSSIQNAFARLGLHWEDASLLSLHGRPIEGFINRLQKLSKVACLTDPKNSPQAIAHYLLSFGERDWKAFVCENLGSKDELVREFTLGDLSQAQGISDLNVLILTRISPQWQRPRIIPFHTEEEYAKRMPKKGLITKREVRILSLAALELTPTSVVWDIGAGSGSVAIEAAQVAEEGRVYAIEVDPEGAEICRHNRILHKTDNVQVIEGRAPEILTDLEDPDAIFVGGSKGSMEEIIHVSLKRLKKGGRLVVNAITLDNVSEAYQTFRSLGLIPEVTLLNISRGEKLANYVRYDALNPIHIFKVIRPEEPERNV